MSRLTLKDIPEHLWPASERKPKRAKKVVPPFSIPPVSDEVAWELMSLRAQLCRCAARMVPAQGSIMAEVGRIERVVSELKELGIRLEEAA